MSASWDLVNLLTLLNWNTLPGWLWLLLWGSSLAVVMYWQRRWLQRDQVGFPDVIMLARADTTVVECNEACQKILGDWRGRRWIDVLLAEEQEQAQQKIAHLTPQQPTFTRISRVADAAGQVRWFEWINQGIFDRRGRFQFIRGVGRDITEKKQLEENLRLREAQLRTLLDALPLAVWARDPQGVLILQNATDRAWFGDLLGTSLEEAAREYPHWLEYTSQVLSDVERQGFCQFEGKEMIQGQERYTYRFAVKLQDQSKGLGLLGIVLDITEQKRLEQEVWEQEERFRAFLNNSHDILCRIDAQGLLHTLNPPAAEKILGRAPNQGEAVPLDWVHPEDRQNVANALEQLKARPGETLSFIYRAQHADGQWVWLESLCTNLLEDPSVQGIVSSTRDITQQKQVELALRESEARFREIAEAVPVVFFVYSADLSQSLYKSPQSEKIWGYTAEEFRRKPDLWKDRIHPEDLPRVLQAAARATQEAQQITYRLFHRDGRLRWLRTSCRPILNEQQEVIRIVGITEDITEQKEAELALQESEARLRAILDGIPFSIFLKDLEGRYLHVNKTYLQQRGCKAEELFGKLDSELFASEEALEFRDQDQKVLQSPHPVSYERTFFRDGKRLTQWVTKFALRDQQGSPYAVCGIAVDITPLKQAQDLLLKEAERERLLGALLRRIRQDLDLQSILQTTVAEVREVFQVDRVMIYQLQEGVGGFVAAESVADPWPSHLGRYVWDEYFQRDPRYRKYQEGFVQAIANVATANLDPCYRELLESFQAQANLVIPIRQGEALWGLLVVQHCQSSRPWQEWEIRLLQELSDQLAIALQQAQLYEQLQALNQTLEEKVRQRTSELQRSLQFEALLKRITDRVRDSLDEAEILNTALRELGENLNADGCDIGLYNADLTLSTISYEYCPRSNSSLNISISIKGGPYDDVHQQLLAGQPCLFCFYCPEKTVEKRQVVMACPLPDKGQVLGDLWIFRSAERSFDQQEMQLIQQVANQCAIGLRQARLFRAAQEQVQALERLNRLKDDFISTVSHELRTPLASMKMALHMLQVAPAREKQAQYLSIAQRECQREIELINDLLDLQRLEAGAYALNLQTLTWEALLGDLLLAIGERARTKGQTFQANVPLESSITTDPLLLGRILRELLHNAVKYTPGQGSIRLEVRVEANRTRIQVRNSQEIPAEELTRIFDRFYRIPSHDPWKEGGTGLGLALVKQMVDQLRGSIEVSSAAGWTTFTLHLPPLPQF
ncbi:histidine kinase [Synechococcus sp. 60AY4M2]|uniref:PAS domain S-box protein n=1 Tax=unclassified Synechococcus TaxID=2626047 RepID=UPI000C187F23|nr:MULTISPECIES: PAS domain S-box protein [unclassified Synechococcus]PIK93959.1 histidine kinase [Synechococcus sp. 60AY4M2]PIK98544.1 histidine kinase [Synechococcus sp. 63AY4M1]PIL00728.1 histidine kinase [Synechococcus sp. 65AY640]